MLSAAFAAAVAGVEGLLVRAEAHSAAGTPAFNVIGLPDRSIAESRERVRAAIANSGLLFPAGRVLVNLAPADVRKEGPAFDLAIALALLAIDEQVDPGAVSNFVALGELALDGSLRPIRGTLAMALAAREGGIANIIVPAQNAGEAGLVDGIAVYGIGALLDAIAVIAGNGAHLRATRSSSVQRHGSYGGDFADVRGQAGAKRALEIAAAGGHNVLLVGPPGCGKTMLAQRLPSILPPVTRDEALDITKIWSIAGALPNGAGVIETRPFRSPHHTVSRIALVGGGSVPGPGEISLAHHGVLFLDELPEFSRATIEALRQPLELGRVSIGRVHSTCLFPARFALIAAMNPCPCGFRGTRTSDCRCDDAAVARYLAQLSGPILDRIDVHIEVHRLPFDDMYASTRAERSEAIRARVQSARERQTVCLQRGNSTNASMDAEQATQRCALSADAIALMRAAASRGMLSARALDRITRVARTIADLADCERITCDHLAEAIGYRVLDRRGLAA